MAADLLLSLAKVAAVFGLLFITLRLLGTWHRQRGTARPSGRPKAPLVEKIDEMRVGRGGSVVAVRVGETVLLLGVTEQRIDHLADVTESIDLTSVDEDDEPDRDTGPSPLDHALALLRQRTSGN